MAKNSSQNCMIDWANRTIRVTDAFYKKARVFGTTEFNHLVNIRKQLPDYSIERVVRKNGTSKLTYEKMETYLLRYVSQEAADELNARRAARITLADGTVKAKETFFSIRAWFIKKYPSAEGQIKKDEQQEETEAFEIMFDEQQAANS